MGSKASKVHGEALTTSTTSSTSMGVKDINKDSSRNSDMPFVSKKPLRKRKYPTQAETETDQDQEQSHEERSENAKTVHGEAVPTPTPSPSDRSHSLPPEAQRRPILPASDLSSKAHQQQHPDDSSKPTEETTSLGLSEDERDAILVLQHLNALAHPSLVYPHMVWPQQHQLPVPVPPFVQSSSSELLQPRSQSVSTIYPHQPLTLPLPLPPTTTSCKGDGIQMNNAGYRTISSTTKTNKRRNGERGADKRPRAPRHCKRCLTYNGSNGTTCLGRTKRGIDACQYFDASGQAKA
jgi:hypothetical protein